MGAAVGRGAGVGLGEKGLGWWSYHFDRFLQYCRDRGEQIEVKLLARGFYDSLNQAEPDEAGFNGVCARDRGLALGRNLRSGGGSPIFGLRHVWIGVVRCRGRVKI